VGFVGKVLLFASVAMGVACHAQTDASAVTAPVAVAPIVFEVTSVKVNKSGNSGSHSSFDNGRFIATNVSLKNLMQYSAYEVPEVRILGGPKWMDSARFDIEAKLDGPGTERLRALGRHESRLQTLAMMQELLADRFKLAVHWETRELPVYALVAGKNGARLEAAKKADKGTSIETGNNSMTADDVTMADLARAMTQELSSELGRVVVDKTGIAGKYDLALKWTPVESSASIDTGPSIFTAVQEQLGLKLESAKAPVEVLVIDHVAMPQEN